jgi:hypothetical protein
LAKVGWRLLADEVFDFLAGEGLHIDLLLDRAEVS